MPRNNPGMKIHTLGRPVAWTLVAVLVCPLAGIAGTHPVIVKNTPANHIAEEVLHNLLPTPDSQSIGGEPSGLRLVSLGGGPINLRLSREREYEADHVGLLLMAQAG